MTQLNLGKDTGVDYIFLNFEIKDPACCKKYLSGLNTVASIWHENIHPKNFPLDIIIAVP